MILVRKKLQVTAEEIIKPRDPSQLLITDFVKALKAKKLTPEEFLRALDVKNEGKVQV